MNLPNEPENWEAKRVAEKFRSADAVIGEENVDYVAFIYMNLEQAIYWLPRFLEYLRAVAPRDSFHFESMIIRLSHADWVSEFRRVATPETQTVVRNFLTWLNDQPIMAGAPDLRRTAYTRAVELWK